MKKQPPDFPRIPKETDDEVLYFHPVFEFAANIAINELGLMGKIKLIHHYSIGSRSVDFAFQLVSSAKMILLAEIKRTKAAVQSTNNRLQAKNYVTEAGWICAHPYYLVTNLEIVDLFKYISSRPKVSQQLIKPSPIVCKTLGEPDQEVFYQSLTAAIKTALDIALGDKGKYYAGLSSFQQSLEHRMDDSQSWHEFFIPAAFEYIRGASTHFPGMKRITSTWRPAENYKDAPENLSQGAKRIDFDGIFNPSATPGKSEIYDRIILEEMFSAGTSRADGEDVASIVGDTLASLGPGIIETDDELSNVLSIIAAAHIGRALTDSEIICDPSAGSGRLLLSAVKHLKPSRSQQIWAIEREKRFSQALYLRLGLAFGETLTPNNTPKISMSDLVNINKNEFDAVKVVLMNPPFISGIESVEEKRHLAQRIAAITGRPSICNAGQSPLECVYLELVNSLTNRDTVISSIVPIRHLAGQGPEAVNFRRFLLNDFNLQMVVIYPKKGLFEDVVKQTMIVVGKKSNIRAAEVRIVNIQTPLSNLDLDEFSKYVAAQSSSSRSAEIISTNRAILEESLEDGWSNLVGVRKFAKDWIDRLFNGFSSLGSISSLKRGGAGNNGCSDLATITPNSPYRHLLNLVPDHWKVPGINNAEEIHKEITRSSPPRIALLPPQQAFDISTSDHAILESIAAEYLAIKEAKKKTKGTQRKDNKDIPGVIRSLRASRLFDNPATILIPRANRVEAQTGVAFCPIVTSTNIFSAGFSDIEKAKIVASFLSSCFSQLEMELLGINQEGARKLEGSQISALRIPDISSISADKKTALVQSYMKDSHINFKNLVACPTDVLWAGILTGGEQEKVDAFLRQCIEYLSVVSADRQA